MTTPDPDLIRHRTALLAEVIDLGPYPGQDHYCLQVRGMAATRLLPVTPAEVTAIVHLLGGATAQQLADVQGKLDDARADRNRLRRQLRDVTQERDDALAALRHATQELRRAAAAEASA